MNKIPIFYGALLLSLSLSAQQNSEFCGFDKLNEPFRLKSREIENIIYNRSKQALNTNKKGFSSSFKTVNGVYEIPVVVHVIVPTGAVIGSDYNKSDAQIQSWIDDCNKMYAGTYQWSQTPPDFGTAATMPIKLVLAKRDPNCNATTGIIRYDGGSLSGYNDYGVKLPGGNNTTTGVTIDQVKTLSPHWAEDSYFNIYIIHKVDGQAGNVGVAGWAGTPEFPNSGYESFMRSSIVTIPNNITFAHEFGHAMGLLHTFGNADNNPPAGTTSTTYCPPQTYNDCKKDDDGVCDTERSRSLLQDYPIPTNNDMNYCTGANFQGVQYNMMNYGLPGAFKFTNGQHDRAATRFFLMRGSLSTSLGATAPTTASNIGIPIAACTPTGVTNAATNGYFVGPTLVKLGNINNASTGLWYNATNYYEDYTGSNCLKSTSTTLLMGQVQNLQVNVSFDYNDVRAWIDFNNNSIFETSELVASGDNIIADPATSIGIFNATFTAPSSTVLNTPLRMRIIVDDENPNITPCGQLIYGQAEDYTVKFVSSLSTNEVKTNDNDLTIYPNPIISADKVQIKAENGKNLKISIMDMSGRLVANPSTISKGNGIYEINHQFENGVYTVYISDGKNNKSSKLIVK